MDLSNAYEGVLEVIHRDNVQEHMSREGTQYAERSEIVFDEVNLYEEVLWLKL
jgi:hypothetical protein